MSTLCSTTCNANDTYTHIGSVNLHSTKATSARTRTYGWLLAPLRFLKTRVRQHIDRQAFDNLLRLDDQMLKDVGVTRSDVVWASKLPLSQDAAAQLEIIARRR